MATGRDAAGASQPPMRALVPELVRRPSWSRSERIGATNAAGALLGGIGTLLGVLVGALVAMKVAARDPATTRRSNQASPAAASEPEPQAATQTKARAPRPRPRQQPASTDAQRARTHRPPPCPCTCPCDHAHHAVSPATADDPIAAEENPDADADRDEGEVSDDDAIAVGDRAAREHIDDDAADDANPVADDDDTDSLVDGDQADPLARDLNVVSAGQSESTATTGGKRSKGSKRRAPDSGGGTVSVSVTIPHGARSVRVSIEVGSGGSTTGR